MFTMRRPITTIILVSVCTVIGIVQACRKPELLEEADYNEWLSGGSQTVFDAGSGAFSQAFPSLSADKEALHETGDVAFEATFVSAPAQLRPGLGPIFNSVSCASCHIADGRGRPPEPNGQLVSMLFRMSIPGADPHGGPLGVPGFGGQFQQRAIQGYAPEGEVLITYTEQAGTYADGAPYSLRVPSYTLQNAYTTLPASVMLSPRMAPPVFGLGLLEAIPEANILAAADPGDANGDGISGRPNYVWDVLGQRTALGRFGWKCNQPDLLQQSAGAYAEDMGITNYVFQRESSYGQPQYDNRGDEPEVSDSLLYASAFYIRSLAVPARRNVDDPQVQRGKQLFIAARCASCHTPMQRTGTNVVFPEVSNQVIFPYSDMLLHDMGPGLADNRPDYDASGQEWRTSPLWGIGLTQAVNGHQYFLHDGRARSLEEAILWHGGEATYSQQYFSNLSMADRTALLAFLNSL